MLVFLIWKTHTRGAFFNPEKVIGIYHFTDKVPLFS